MTSVDFADQKDGTYVATYSAAKPGMFTLEVKLQRRQAKQHVPGSPFKVLVRSESGDYRSRASAAPQSGQNHSTAPDDRHSRGNEDGASMGGNSRHNCSSETMREIQKWTSRLTRFTEIAEQSEQPGEVANAKRLKMQAEKKIEALKRGNK
jgi:hypothetical protein